MMVKVLLVVDHQPVVLEVLLVAQLVVLLMVTTMGKVQLEADHQPEVLAVAHQLVVPVVVHQPVADLLVVANDVPFLMIQPATGSSQQWPFTKNVVSTHLTSNRNSWTKSIA